MEHKHSKRHQTQVIFSGCAGVGPKGEQGERGEEELEVPQEGRSLSRERNDGRIELDLNAVGKAIRGKYKQLGFPKLRAKLQIDSAGGHGMTRGTKAITKLKAIMNDKYSIELVQQPPQTLRSGTS